MNDDMGHNSSAQLRLAESDARHGLDVIAKGEGQTVEGWLIYGAALNVGRGLHKGDTEFGQWVTQSQLGIAPDGTPIKLDDRSAAMWAAAEPVAFEWVRAEFKSTRTVRGWHDKWKAILSDADATNARHNADLAKASAQAAAADAKVKRLAAESEQDADKKAVAEADAIATASEAKAKENAAKKAEAEATKAEKKDKEKRAHVSQNSGENEWYTPARFIDAARAVMGGFDLDPASSEIANRTVKADLIFTAEDDGLKQDWPIGRIWMNPPYAQPLMGQFADKFATEVRRGSEGVVLVNNATETAWFQTIAAECAAICFPKTRIKFVDPQGNASGAPLQGQAIIYCGPHTDAFVEAFSGFGLVVLHG